MAHTAFDGEQIMFINENLAQDEFTNKQQVLEEFRKKFSLFLRDWTRSRTYFYREQILKPVRILTVDLEELNAFDSSLYAQLLQQPDELIPQLEQGATDVYLQLNQAGSAPVEYQINLISNQYPISLRDLHSNLIGQLVIVPGLIIQSTQPRLKATTIKLQCQGCQNTIQVKVDPGLGRVTIPKYCQANRRGDGIMNEKCPVDPFRIVADQSQYIDQQLGKLQELLEQVPTGEMPRSVNLVMDKNMVDYAQPGSRVNVAAILSVSQRGKSSVLKNSYLRVVGMMNMQQGYDKLLSYFTTDDEEKFMSMARDPEIYDKISSSIAPSIYKNKDIKKAIACLLFGGSRKRLPDGVKIRGDINVLLIGDPSTAKSQFLKFVSRAAPIAVYTSGKGSSAAGLTASIKKDNSGKEFQLEGGAMVLADGGVVCIDEFDKMRPDDRVAIHEAMEQQTISIAKAGITTILNSRVSVLAAANPTEGSYNDLKESQEQINFQSSILSRFDCIFIVRDKRDQKHDIRLAEHVVKLHMGGQLDLEERPEIDIDDLKRYIAYARTQCQPRLSEEAGKEVQNFYVADRKKQRQAQGIPITVRQLEAIIRISESIARMSLSPVVTVDNVREAHRLFEVSTLNAASQGLSNSGISIPPQVAQLVMQIEDYIKQHLNEGSRIQQQVLKDRLMTLFSNERAIAYAINNMISRQELQHRDHQNALVRIK